MQYIEGLHDHLDPDVYTTHHASRINTQVGEAFQRLGKPLSPADLAAYIASVDVDGNGVVDKDEFEHMTRRLLSIACQPSCHSCRLLYQRQVCISLCVSPPPPPPSPSLPLSIFPLLDLSHSSSLPPFSPFIFSLYPSHIHTNTRKSTTGAQIRSEQSQ